LLVVKNTKEQKLIYSQNKFFFFDQIELFVANIITNQLMIILNGWELPHPKNFIYKLLIEFYLISSKFYQVYQGSS